MLKYVQSITFVMMLAFTLTTGTGIAFGVNDDTNTNGLTAAETDAKNTNVVEASDDEGDIQSVISNRSDIDAGTYYIQSKFLNTQVLDTKGKSVRLSDIKGGKTQRWAITVGIDGYATIKNISSGKVLAVKGGKACPGAPVVQQVEKKPSSKYASALKLQYWNLAQKWIVVKQKDEYIVCSALNTNYKLHINGKTSSAIHGAELRWYKKIVNRQLFTITPVKPVAAKKGTRSIANGVYLIAPTSKANQAITITGNFKKSGANAEIDSFAANTKQAFKFTYNKKGYYLITNTKSGKMLAPAAACSISGVNVGQYSLSSKNSRALWRVDKIKGGYRLVNKATGLALQMDSDEHADGTNVRAATVDKSKTTQCYSLVRPCKLSPNSSQIVGVKYLVMASNKSKVIGTRDDSRFEDALVSIRDKSDTNVQRFKIKKAGGKYYYLQNTATKRVMSLSKASKAKNVNVVMSWKDGGDYQKWKVVYNDDFSYAFVNKYSGMHLHVSGAKSNANTKVKVWSKNTTAKAQAFKLVNTAFNSHEGVALGVPCYYQYPELPTGCEALALTNTLRYWGFDLSKTEIVDDWMPYGDDGVYNFIGNPYDEGGWIICAPGIANTANDYLSSKGANLRADVYKGASLAQLREHLYMGEPLIVWTTMYMEAPLPVQWWNDGYPMLYNNHAVVLCGYDPDTGDYLVADSLDGTVWRPGSWFKYLYEEMGSQAVLIYRC